MKRRFTRLPIASIAVVIGCFLVGLSMSQVDAQSVLTNGQVAVRSDGAVYLISNSMRRWVATVVISDEDLNAYPEAEPIYAGLAPLGGGSTGATTTGAPAASASPTTNTAGAKPTAPGSTTGSTPTGSATTDSSAGQVTADPASGADAKDPNDPTLAAAPATVDPSGRTKPSGGQCPASHQIKGGPETNGVKYYYDPERPEYPSITPEECFRAGKDARDAGYVEIKKRT
jgi:hypothetical protein